MACGGGNGKSNSSSSTATSSSSSVVSSLSSIPSVSSNSSSSLTSSSTSSESSVASSASSATWSLVWSDEFNGTAIDSTKWSYEKNCWGGGNNEQQCYTDQEKNAFVADGVLNIVAVKEDFTGPDTPEGEGSSTKTLPYTSARLRTKNLQEWTFGRFEIRAKLPQGQGTWPAIWMLPTDSPYGIWASSGEIDIMEAVNLNTRTTVDGVLQPPETHVYGTLHYGKAWPGNVSSGEPYALPNSASPADDFHTYALEWEQGEIRWYVDGVHYATQRQTGWYSQYMVDGVLTDAPLGAPFDEKSAYHLLLNLAVGGAWAGTVNNTGIDPTVFPQKMQVDYVRVYECSAAPQTGKGCATIGENAVVNPGKPRPVIGDVELPGPPLFTLYDNELATGLSFDTYNPDGVISYSEVTETGRGNILNIVKTGANGNVYFKVSGNPTDLRNWSADSKLIFDVKVNSKAAGAKLLIKLDSGWPNVSDVEVPLPAEGEWAEYSITLADLIDNGNSLASGKASLASIANIFVIDPSGAMNVSFDNIRIEGDAAEVVDEFAAPPLFKLYEDNVASGLQVQSYNPDNAITSTEITEIGRGDVFNVVKTGANGNVFFNVVAGPANLNSWPADGELVFDVKINSKAVGSKLFVKMDSGWPNVSDAEVSLASDGVWSEYRIKISDLIDNGNSNLCCPGIANLSALTNLFVIEPTGAMDVSFDNMRLEVPTFASPPLFTMFEDSLASGLQVQSYNPDGKITSSQTAETNRGNFFNVVKTGANGNVFFNVIDGAADISSWPSNGKLVFDFKVNSKATGSKLFVKLDSGWPNVSDVEVPLAADGIWSEFSIGIADLLNNGNSNPCCPGAASASAITNIFVIEPSDLMDVSFDNIRLIVE
ncbi:MAG: glycoside hydrolase family 16 protein [Gammaproteobacteria bacterium]|nr:MAG: glycoside hydrolase family 16 protein [Gammaproteobacteria bacterium]